MLTRAYSTFEIKSVDDEQRVIEGIASTPTTDRMGDVVEPAGAKFALPIPLLWQHRSDQPIGRVLSATVTKSGIAIKAQIEKGLLPRIDEAWALIKSGLVRGLSIGFRPTEDPEVIKGTYGLRFTAWEWLELSAVTIPANQDASIHVIRSLDAEHLAASGRRDRVSSPPPGATGSRRNHSMTKNASEQITELKSQLKVKAARMGALAEIESEDGQSLDDTQQAEYDGLTDEVKSLSTRIDRLEALEMANSRLSKGVEGGNSHQASISRDGGTPRIQVRDTLPPGIEFARYVICKMAALLSQGGMSAVEVAKARYPDQPRIQTMLKAAVAGGTTTDAGWAGNLVDPTNLASEFIEYLRPMTIVGKFGTNGVPSLRRVPFNVRITGQSSGGTAYWVGQGVQKPLTKFDTSATTLGFAKIATIAVISDELARFSSPSAEALVRDELARAVVERMDIDFIDPAKAAVANVSPASITHGLVALTPSGTNEAAVRADLGTLLSTYLAANQNPTNAVLIMPNTVALNLSLMVNTFSQPAFPGLTMNGGTLLGLPVITSQYAATVLGSPTSNIVAIVNASDVFLSDDGGVSVDASREASLEMSDDPANDSGTVVSMYQTNQIALRAERYVNWQKRRPEAAAYFDGVAWA